MSTNNQAIEDARDSGQWIIATESHEAMSCLAANLIISELRKSPDLLLCAAAGLTPRRTYQLLVQKRRDEPSLFSSFHLLKLDEWGGIEMTDSASCETYLQEHLVQPLEISSDRYIGFESRSHDPQSECERIRAILAARPPVDLCILGLGANGHLGLNEPSESLQPFAHVVQPTASSLKHSMLESSNVRPPYGLTIGMADILGSRRILLLVSGQHKKEQLERLRLPEISTHFPASFLWLHPHAVCLYVEEASQAVLSPIR